MQSDFRNWLTALQNQICSNFSKNWRKYCFVYFGVAYLRDLSVLLGIRDYVGLGYLCVVKTGKNGVALIC